MEIALQMQERWDGKIWRENALNTQKDGVDHQLSRRIWMRGEYLATQKFHWRQLRRKMFPALCVENRCIVVPGWQRYLWEKFLDPKYIPESAEGAPSISFVDKSRCLTLFLWIGEKRRRSWEDILGKWGMCSNCISPSLFLLLVLLSPGQQCFSPVVCRQKNWYLAAGPKCRASFS